MKRHIATSLLRIAAGLIASFAPALAQEYPARAITMVVPYPAGGVTDGMARLIGERMQASLGQTVIVENVGGGSGAIGVGRVARAAPDGYTIVLGNLETNLTNAVAQQLNFDVFKDFDPVGLLPSYPFILVSKNDVPAKTLPELIGWLKQNREKVFQGTVGAGTIQHLCGLRLHEILGVQWSFIPYRGGGPAMQDMLAGQFDFMCTASGSFLPLVRNNQIRAYAVTARTRMPGAPEIPTAHEAGLPGFYVGVWNAIWAPAGTPKPIIARLNQATVFAMNDEGLRKKIVDMGLDMPPADQLSPEALGAFQKAEAETWWPVMRRMKEELKK